MTTTLRRPSRTRPRAVPLLATTLLVLLGLLLTGSGTANAQFAVPPFIGANDIELQVLTEETQDPTAIDVAADGRVVFVERKGAVKVILPSGDVVTAGRVPTAANECDDCPDDLNEGGLHGLLLSPERLLPWAQPIGDVLPMSHALELLRDSMLRGLPLTAGPIATLVGMAVGTIAIGSWLAIREEHRG